jgi:hypothetical protein
LAFVFVSFGFSLVLGFSVSGSLSTLHFWPGYGHGIAGFSDGVGVGVAVGVGLGDSFGFSGAFEGEGEGFGLGFWEGEEEDLGGACDCEGLSEGFREADEDGLGPFVMVNVRVVSIWRCCPGVMGITTTAVEEGDGDGDGFSEEGAGVLDSLGFWDEAGPGGYVKPLPPPPAPVPDIGGEGEGEGACAGLLVGIGSGLLLGAGVSSLLDAETSGFGAMKPGFEGTGTFVTLVGAADADPTGGAIKPGFEGTGVGVGLLVP